MPDDDPLVAILAEITAHRFPAVLQEPPALGRLREFPRMLGEPRFIPNFGLILEHPRIKNAEAAIAADPVLSVFAERDEGAFIHTTLGRGWRVQPRTLALGLISSTVQQVAFRGRAQTLEILLEELHATVTRFRELVSGGTVTTVTTCAFDGVALAPESSLTTPWGVLREPTLMERGSPHGLQATVVLDTETEVRFSVSLEDAPDTQVYATVRPGVIERAPFLFPLAALLGLQRETLVVPEAMWIYTLVPGETGIGFGGNYRLTPLHSSGGAPLSAREEEQLVAWAERIETHYDAAVEIAVRRTLSALQRFRSPEDALIDAVIAWENLFGAGGRGDTTFRLSTALAIVLETEPKNRDALAKRFAKVYGGRSEVVHGEGVSDASSLRDEAIAAAIKALRQLFASYPHLIPDKRRGRRLLLGAADRAPGPPA